MNNSPWTKLQNPPGFEIDLNTLLAFEQGLNPRKPEAGAIPARVLGYGEISTVFSIEAERLHGLAFKRLPIFRTQEEMVAYGAIYEGYIRLLEDEVGIPTAPQGYAAFVTPTGRPVFYIIQRVLPAHSIGHKAIHILDEAGVKMLLRVVLRRLARVWEHNQRQEQRQVAIDGQLSNWAIAGFDAGQPAISEHSDLLYLDTSTPLFRVAGVEQLDPELFLRSAPSFLRWILRLLFLKDVVSRYYDFHLVAVDAIANFYKDQRPELIPGLIEVANDFFLHEVPALGIAPVTFKEVEAYYKEDATIWRLYLSMRKIDRFLHTRLLGREYPYILPDRVRR
jgi:hypothetical protein